MKLNRVLLATALCAASACNGGPSPMVSITSLEPASGPAGVATEVRIRGTGFRSGATVSFGAPATDVSVLDDKTILAKTPTFLDGSVSVNVRNADGSQATLAGGFQFIGTLPPTVQSLEPKDGMIGWLVRVTGFGFKSGAVVSFGGVNAKQTIFEASNRLLASVPPGISGVVDVTVTNPGGPPSSALASAFTVHPVTLTASASAVAAAEPVSVTWDSPLWTASEFPQFDDWIGLFVSASLTQKAAAAWWATVPGSQGTLNLTAPVEPGQYEFRYVSGGVVQTAITITVNPAPQ